MEIPSVTKPVFYRLFYSVATPPVGSVNRSFPPGQIPRSSPTRRLGVHSSALRCALCASKHHSHLPGSGKGCWESPNRKGRAERSNGARKRCTSAEQEEKRETRRNGRQRKSDAAEVSGGKKPNEIIPLSRT